MSPCIRRWIVLCVLAFTSIFLWMTLTEHARRRSEPIDRLTNPGFFHAAFKWKDVPMRHPVSNLTALPAGPNAAIPKVQFEFLPESHELRVERQQRLAAVKEAFLHSWEGYKQNAWLQDEVAPLTGEYKNGFGGWGATLVDSLDSLVIMGLDTEFMVALEGLRKVHFTTADLDKLNVFETTIRYLGGLLSAYDLSGQVHSILMERAIDLGEMLYVAFDTPNRMPVTRWDWKNGALGGDQLADRHALLAEVGSLSLEFTRLSQLTGDPKWYDAIARITDVFEQQQNRTKIPGLWPVFLDVQNNDFRVDITFTLGGMADSVYEYLPKQHLMLGGQSDQYRGMYQTALESAKRNIFFRPLNPSNTSMLIPGTVKRHSARNHALIPQGQHLTCFAGGMVALAAKIFDQPQEIQTARELVDGCLWAYDSMNSGIGPEIFTAISCHPDSEDDDCTWSDDRWYAAVARHANGGGDSRTSPTAQAQKVIAANRLAPGFLAINDARYILRPEAIESLFVLYRITGDKTLQDRAWQMFQAINSVTKTSIAYASVNDVTMEEPELFNSMESFWTAETLKYFYLIFSEPDVVSLDKYVLNTEAHPLLRPAD